MNIWMYPFFSSYFQAPKHLQVWKSYQLTFIGPTNHQTTPSPGEFNTFRFPRSKASKLPKSWDADEGPLIINAYTPLYSGYLVGGWTNPSEKYSSRWVHLPQIGLKIKHIWNPPPRYLFGMSSLKGSYRGIKQVRTIFHMINTLDGSEIQLTSWGW